MMMATMISIMMMMISNLPLLLPPTHTHHIGNKKNPQRCHHAIGIIIQPPLLLQYLSFRCDRGVAVMMMMMMVLGRSRGKEGGRNRGGGGSGGRGGPLGKEMVIPPSQGSDIVIVIVVVEGDMRVGKQEEGGVQSDHRALSPK